MAGEWDALGPKGLRMVIDVRPLDPDSEALMHADTQAMQDAVMAALVEQWPAGQVVVSMNIRRLVG
jgi:hypothetical protein